MNREVKVHLCCSLWLSVENRQILLDRCTEGWQHCIGIWIAENTIYEETMTASSVRAEKGGE